MQRLRDIATCNARAPEVLRICVHEVHIEPLLEPCFDCDVRVHADVEIKEVIRSSENLRNGQHVVLEYEGGRARTEGSAPPPPLLAGEEVTAFLGRRRMATSRPCADTRFWKSGAGLQTGAPVSTSTSSMSIYYLNREASRSPRWKKELLR